METVKVLLPKFEPTEVREEDDDYNFDGEIVLPIRTDGELGKIECNGTVYRIDSKWIWKHGYHHALPDLKSRINMKDDSLDSVTDIEFFINRNGLFVAFTIYDWINAIRCFYQIEDDYKKLTLIYYSLKDLRVDVLMDSFIFSEFIPSRQHKLYFNNTFYDLDLESHPVRTYENTIVLKNNTALAQVSELRVVDFVPPPTFESMYNVDLFRDVELVGLDGSRMVHGIVMHVVSDYFRTAYSYKSLSGDDGNRLHIHTTVDVLDAMIDVWYLGRTDRLKNETIDSYLAIASELLDASLYQVGINYRK